MKKWCLILMGLALVVFIILGFCGCGLGGLHWVPDGQTPPEGSKPAGKAFMDGMGGASESGWGDVIQVLAGFVGCGTVVAVGRKALRDRARRKELNQQKTALQEIIGGVQELRQNGNRAEITEIDAILNAHQKSLGTRKIVADAKIKNATV